MAASAFKTGVTRSFFYSLINDNTGTPNSGDIEANFGLFDGSGNPKPAAVALRNVNLILTDSTSNAASFTTSKLNYSISNMPAGGSVLLQKANGVFYILVWSEDSSKQNLTVNFGRSHGTIRVYNPTQSSSATSTLSNASSAAISGAGSLVILEVVN